MWNMAVAAGEVVSYTPYILGGAALLVIVALLILSCVKKK